MRSDVANTHIATVSAALLHEALMRANKVAPTKGAAHDRAAGIQIEFRVDEAHVRATDLDVTFYQKIPVEQVSEECTLRLSGVVPPFVASLSMDKNQVIRFFRDDRKKIIIQYMKTRTKATIPQIEGEYPEVPWYDYEEMSDAAELGAKVSAVSWATEGDAQGVLSAIKIDGGWLEALSSRNAARIKCDIEAEATVYAVLKTLVPLIKSGSRLRMATTKEGRVIVALDETCQVTSTTVLGQWPNLVERLEKFEFPNTVTIRKMRLAEALGRVLSFVRNDRLPKVMVTLTKDSIDVVLRGTMNGDVQDSCAIANRTGSTEDVVFFFNPTWLLEAIETFPGASVLVEFNGPLQPIRLSEPSTSYEAYVMPMRDIEEGD
jgi:DNA polymerase III sliding clamp (beta) subunit (PCNA family)